MKSFNVRSFLIVLLCSLMIVGLSYVGNAQKQFPFIHDFPISITDSIEFERESASSLILCNLVASRGLKLDSKVVSIARHWREVQNNEILESGIDTTVRVIDVKELIGNKTLMSVCFVQQVSGKWLVSYYFKGATTDLNFFVNERGLLVNINVYKYTRETELISSLVIGDLYIDKKLISKY